MPLGRGGNQVLDYRFGHINKYQKGKVKYIKL